MFYQMNEPEPEIVEASAVCDCGCDDWLPVYEGDYPLVDHWECANCGNRL